MESEANYSNGYLPSSRVELQSKSRWGRFRGAWGSERSFVGLSTGSPFVFDHVADLRWNIQSSISLFADYTKIYCNSLSLDCVVQQDLGRVANHMAT